MITWEEYIRKPTEGKKDDYKQTNIACPKCGMEIWEDVRIVFPTYQPKHKYVCFMCGWSGTH